MTEQLVAAAVCPRCENTGWAPGEMMRCGRAYSCVRFCECECGRRREVYWWAGKVRDVRALYPNATARGDLDLQAYCRKQPDRAGWLPAAVDQELTTGSWTASPIHT